MRTIRLILLVGVLLLWRDAARAGNAVMLKSYSYQTVRAGFPMPKRLLRMGVIVKVLAMHGAKADVMTPGGDTVTVPLKDLRLLPDPATTATAALQSPAVVAPPHPDPTPSPNPTVATVDKASPSPAGAGGEKPDGAGAAHPGSETDPRSTPVRCSHLTRKGEQCSRMTTSPNGLCWQHGGN